MKHFLAIAALFASAAVQAGTVGFNGAYDPTNWAASPAGLVSASNSEVSLTSLDDGVGGYTSFTITMVDTGKVSFDWDYSTDDSPLFEVFGYLLNGLFSDLTDPAGSQSQSGSASVFVQAGDVFGFAAYSVDGQFGPATTRITGFSVPEPGTFALAVLAFLGAAAARRRRLAA